MFAIGRSDDRYRPGRRQIGQQLDQRLRPGGLADASDAAQCKGNIRNEHIDKGLIDIRIAVARPRPIIFSDGNNAQFAYTLMGVSQTKAITRQVFGPVPTCVWGALPDLAHAQETLGESQTTPSTSRVCQRG